MLRRTIRVEPQRSRGRRGPPPDKQEAGDGPSLRPRACPTRIGSAAPPVRQPNEIAGRHIHKTTQFIRKGSIHSGASIVVQERRLPPKQELDSKFRSYCTCNSRATPPYTIMHTCMPAALATTLKGAASDS